MPTKTLAIDSGNTGDLLDWKVMKMLRDFNVTLARNTLKFKVLNKDHLEIQGDFMGLLEKLSAGGRSDAKPNIDLAEYRPKENLTFTIAGDELTLTSKNGKSIKFKRSE